MSTTTDQRDELAKALKEAIALFKKHVRAAEVSARAHRKAHHVDRSSKFIWSIDSPETYLKMKEFIEKWEIK